MTLEQLLALLIVLLLFTSIARRLGRRAVQRSAPAPIEDRARELLPRVRMRPRIPAPEGRWRRGVSAGAPVAAPPPAPAAHRRRARSRLGRLPEVRRGIVLMTILGPCRALEPPRPPT